jgi:hypothetical protein
MEHHHRRARTGKANGINPAKMIAAQMFGYWPALPISASTDFPQHRIFRWGKRTKKERNLHFRAMDCGKIDSP